MRVMFSSLMFCYPVTNGNKKTSMDLIAHLIGQGHEVVCVYPAIAEGKPEAFQKLMGSALTLMPSAIPLGKRLRSSLNARVWSRFSAPINSYLARADLAAAARISDVLIFDYWVVLADYLKAAKANAKPILVKVNDILYPRITTDSTPTWPLVSTLRAIYRQREFGALRKADALLSCSQRETGELNARGLDALEMPVACDLTQFRPDPRIAKEPASALFVGAENNVNFAALKWLADAVVPRVAKQIGEFRLHVLWRNPSPPVAALFKQNPRLVRHDWVEDLAGFYNRFPIALLPFFNATGVKVKLIEALASGLAVVSTTDGATGTALKAGEDAFIADDPKIFAGHIIDLIRDDALQQQMGRRARQFAERNHDLATAFAAVDKWLETHAPTGARP